MALARPLPKADQTASSKASGSTSTTGRSGGGITLEGALHRWYSELAAEGKSPATIAAYQYATGTLVKNVGEGAVLADISPEHITGLIADARAAGKSPSTVSALFRPLRTFALWCVNAGLLERSFVTMKPPKVPVGVVPDLTASQFDLVLATTVTRSRWAFRARRDRAILLLLWTTGARLSEVAGLHVADIDLQKENFVVHGKGGKDRTLPLLPEALGALQTYLTLERPRSAFSSVSDAVWLTGTGELSANGIAQMVRARGAQAGVDGLHPHRFRHAFVGRCLAAGMSDSLVMALTGHSTHAMLARYGAATRATSAMDALRALASQEPVTERHWFLEFEEHEFYDLTLAARFQLLRWEKELRGLYLSEHPMGYGGYFLTGRDFIAFEPFERYGFNCPGPLDNKAHATCYGLVAYVGCEQGRRDDLMSRSRT